MADAEIIAVGSELLTPAKLDTNSLFLTQELNALGVEVVKKTVVGDDRARLTSTVRDAIESAAIVILTGGLGPTEDDVTRDAVSAATGRALVFHQEICDGIAERFRRFNRPMAEINKRQAYLIEGAEALPNPRGTAPGQWLDLDRCSLVLLPGPPAELKPMFTGACLPRLQQRLPKQVIRTRWLRVAGLGESDLDALIAPVYTKYTNPVTTILAAIGDVHIHLRARSESETEAEALLDDVERQIAELLGDRIYSRLGEPLEQVIGGLLMKRGATLSVAESCTGGYVAMRVTNVPGSSRYFRGGFLAYTGEMKTALLGIPAELIARHTAVSEPVALAMARAAAERTGSTYAVSVTGYAGPGGEAPGLVYLGIASPGNTEARRLQFSGDRERVRTLAAQTALDLLRRTLLDS
jgi:nicotinamide-nucleotide amidase